MTDNNGADIKTILYCLGVGMALIIFFLADIRSNIRAIWKDFKVHGHRITCEKGDLGNCIVETKGVVQHEER